MKNSEIIILFESAGYEFKGEEPTGRLLFWDVAQEQNIQFRYDPRTKIKDVMDLICQRVYDNGYHYGKSEIRNDFKKVLGI